MWSTSGRRCWKGFYWHNSIISCFCFYLYFWSLNWSQLNNPSAEIKKSGRGASISSAFLPTSFLMETNGHCSKLQKLQCLSHNIKAKDSIVLAASSIAFFSKKPTLSFKVKENMYTWQFPTEFIISAPPPSWEMTYLWYKTWV